uniref:Mitochondrial distribution and morphology protein 12 n=1 Tax=Kalmanozyma brasiliensis (strain GHG001) TaxID=1365824 RepID=V5GNL2_KALBG
MSLDLDWSLLDDELSVRFLETINRALESSSTSRPSFLGEIRFENLQFGADPPDVAIRSITDIWPDFVSIDDPPLRRRGTRHATPASNATTLVESPTETFAAGHGGEMPLRTYTQFDDAVPPNRIHGPASVISASVAGSVPATPGMGLGGANGYYQQWSTALASRGIRAAGLGPQSSVSQIGAKRDSNSLHPPLPGNGLHWNGTGGRPSLRSTPAASYRSLSGQISPNEPREATPAPSSASQLPSLQMRLSLHWPTTTFRLTVTTSILINYPSPAFMSLPLTLCITGFSLTSGLIVALEGEHQRAHICLVEEDTDVSPAEGKKVSAGMSVLPQLTFESEVGEHEKHVLKNVGKVEKFVAEVIRKGLEDELVYPNYYTIDLPGSKGRT